MTARKISSAIFVVAVIPFFLSTPFTQMLSSHIVLKTKSREQKEGRQSFLASLPFLVERR
jgi:hypothetical protein